MLFTCRIKQNKLFSALYRKGTSIVGKACVVYFRKNGKPFNRMGVASSKKIGNAVKRNRARRVIRAAYRLSEKDFPIGYDFIFVARTAACSVKSGTILAFFKKSVIPAVNKYGEKN